MGNWKPNGKFENAYTTKTIELQMRFCASVSIIFSSFLNFLQYKLYYKKNIFCILQRIW